MSIFCTFDNLTLRAAIQTSQTIFRNHPPQPRLLLSSEDTKIKSHLISIFAINAWQFWFHELLLSNRCNRPSLNCSAGAFIFKRYHGVAGFTHDSFGLRYMLKGALFGVAEFRQGCWGQNHVN